MYCKGVTERKKQCRNKSLKNTEYCRCHTNQRASMVNNNNISNNNKVIQEDTNYLFSDTHVKSTSKSDIQNSTEDQVAPHVTFECFICCETVDEKDKCELVCGHDFCVTCVKKWKTDCPVCRQPITFKKNESELLKTLARNELKCKRDLARDQVNADIEYSTNLLMEERNAINNRRAAGTNATRNVGRNVVRSHDRQLPIPQWVMSESIIYGEINDYNIEIAIIEESILQNESYEDKLIEEVLHVSMTTLTPDQLKLL